MSGEFVTAKKLRNSLRASYKTRPSVRVNWVACLYVLRNTNLGGIESFISNLRIVGRLSRPV